MSEIRFDSGAAEQLLTEMNIYCSGIQKETRDVLEILKTADVWNDRQKKAFGVNMSEIAKDLNQTLKLESEYMKTFFQRVQELRG